MSALPPVGGGAPQEGGAGPGPGYPAPPSYPVPGGGYPGLPGYPVGGPFVGMQVGPAPGVVYAGFWWRLLGYVVDVLFLFIIEAVFTFPLLYLPLIQFYRSHPFVSGQPAPALPTDLSGRFLVIGLLTTLISALYFGGLVAWQGRTIGQRSVGARVVRVEDGGRLPPGRAFWRASIYWGPGVLGVIPYLGSIAGLIAFIGLLSVAWDQRKQGWHDKLGRSVVVRAAPVFPGYS